jgi:hypothetical protein
VQEPCNCSLLIASKEGPLIGAGSWRGERRVRERRVHAPRWRPEKYPLSGQSSALTFYHPDYTVGPGVSPDRGDCRPRARNSRGSELPRYAIFRALAATPRGLYRRSGIGIPCALGPSPCPEGQNVRHQKYSLLAKPASTLVNQWYIPLPLLDGADTRL